MWWDVTFDLVPGRDLSDCLSGCELSDAPGDDCEDGDIDWIPWCDRHNFPEAASVIVRAKDRDEAIRRAISFIQEDG